MDKDVFVADWAGAEPRGSQEVSDPTVLLGPQETKHGPAWPTWLSWM